MCICILQAVIYGDDVVTTPVSYVVSYFGDNITNGSVTVNVRTATIDLPAVDSDINFFVNAINVFGTGDGDDAVDKISELSMYVYIQT